MQTPDLMSFLYEEYKKFNADALATVARDDIKAELPETLPSFLEFAKHYLATQNQPINVSYAAVGLALRLQNGQTLCFASQGKVAPQMRDEGIPISRPQTLPGQYGIVDTSGIPI